MMNLSYQIDLILYQIYKIISNTFSIQIYVNKIENSVTFKIKKGYAIELLTKETMKLLGSTENKITKKKKVKMCHI